MRSRLTERVESQTKRNLVLTCIGIIIIVTLLWKFGVPLLATLSFTLAGSKGEEESITKNIYVAPPTLDDTFNATNSARVSLSGSSLTDATIDLYVNNSKVDSTDVSDGSTFSFDAVPLKNGQNSIKVQAITKENQKSGFSNIVTITYLHKEPSLSIDTPSDGAQFKKDNKTADVKGKTDPGVKVTVNGFWSIVDTEGNYSYSLPLQDGDNDIKVVATDEAGNKIEKQIKVNYSQ